MKQAHRPPTPNQLVALGAALFVIALVAVAGGWLVLAWFLSLSQQVVR